MSIAPRSGHGHRHRAACYACLKPALACICDTVERVANRTGIIILQHPREHRHPVGTARIARLGLAAVRVEPLAPWDDGAAIRARLPERTALLYPTAQEPTRRRSAARRARRSARARRARRSPRSTARR